jgi:hypothetical protein
MILKITSMADLAGLQAGIQMIAQMGAKVVEVMKSVDDFSDAHQRLSLDVSKMIAATRGLIAAQDAYISANKLSSVGIKATAEQLEGLGKKAVEYAQATGQTVPAALQQMTQAVMSGSSKGLRPFGVDVTAAKDKTEAATIALNQFASEMKNVVIEIDSLVDLFGALGTNISDAMFRLAEASEGTLQWVSTLSELNSELSDFNTWMEESPDSTARWATDISGILTSVAQDFFNFIADVSGAIGVQGNYMEAGAREIARGFGDKLGAKNLKYAQDKGAEKTTRDAEKASRTSAGARRPAGGGGGGGKRKGDSGMEFSVEETEASYQESMNDLIGRTPDRWAGVGDTLDAMELEERAKIKAEAAAAEVRAADAVFENALRLMTLREQELVQEVSFAEAYGEAWSSSLGQVSAGSMVAAGAQNMLRGAVTMAANAIVGSSKMTVTAVMEMVKGVSLAIGIEATIRGLMELGLMIAAAASSWGMSPEVEMHAAALAQYAITAAAAFAVAGAASALSGPSKSASSNVTGTKTGQGQYGSPGYSSLGGEQQSTNVTVVLQGDAAGVFSVVDEENRRRSRNGQRKL